MTQPQEEFDLGLEQDPEIDDVCEERLEDIENFDLPEYDHAQFELPADFELEDDEDGS